MLGRDRTTRVVRLKGEKGPDSTPAQVYSEYLEGGRWSKSRRPAEGADIQDVSSSISSGAPLPAPVEG
eukprot:3252896-Alexandrium_andersonii.AAC.1